MPARKIKVGFDVSPYLNQEDFRAFVKSLIDNQNSSVTSNPYYNMDLYMVSNTDNYSATKTVGVATQLGITKYYTVVGQVNLLAQITSLNLEFYFTDNGDDYHYLVDNQLNIQNTTPILVTRLYNTYTLTMKYIDKFYNIIQAENPE